MSATSHLTLALYYYTIVYAESTGLSTLRDAISQQIASNHPPQSFNVTGAERTGAELKKRRTTWKKREPHTSEKRMKTTGDDLIPVNRACPAGSSLERCRRTRKEREYRCGVCATP
jgi:hypothetical protein